MKKLTKLFLLVLCSWFLFFWFSNAQDLIEGDFHTDEYIVNIGYEHQKTYGLVSMWCNCKRPEIVQIYTSFPLLVCWLLLFLSICSILLSTKFNKTWIKSKLFYIPILNLYPLFKNIIWRIWFYILLLNIFFICFVYVKIWNVCACDYVPLSEFYAILMSIILIISLLILFYLLYKLARNFGWWTYSSIIFVIFFPICIRFLIFGNYEYIWNNKDDKILKSK